MSTNVPQPQFLSTGLSVPSEAAVLAGVIADFQAALGSVLNFTNLQTPQGQLVSSMAASISNVHALYTQLVNGVDPDLNSGFMQDAIGRIYFLNRIAGQSTVVTCTCTGLQGTVIPAGGTANPQAEDTSGNLYYCISSGTIPSSGSISLQFANVATGPVGCPAGTLTKIYQAVPGWDSITNAADGVLGADVESRAAFEYRREQSVQSNSQGALQAIYGAVFGVTGVLDVYCYENDTDATTTVGSTNYSMVANSIYVGVVGGASADIAAAIYSKKSPGCAMNGNTSVTVEDTSGYQNPIPTYTIKYNVPTSLEIYFAVSVSGSATLPSDITTLIQTAIVNQFNGENGAPRARIGSLILASQYYAPVFATYSGIELTSIFVGTAASPTGGSVQVGIDQTPVTSAANITVTLT